MCFLVPSVNKAFDSNLRWDPTVEGLILTAVYFSNITGTMLK